MHAQHLACALAAAVAIVAGTARARAAPFTERRVGIGVGIDYGLYLGDAAGDIPTPYGLGLGVRSGYTFDPNVYLGAELNYFFGASQRFPQYGDVEGSLRILQFGAQAGYDIDLGRSFVLRPKLGVGAARVTAKVRVEGLTGEVSEIGLTLTAGAEALYGYKAFFVSLEARYTVLHIDTQPLRDIPGLGLQSGAKLDGLLFFAGPGLVF
jgi:opacity protein-like surface antigen